MSKKYLIFCSVLLHFVSGVRIPLERKPPADFHSENDNKPVSSFSDVTTEESPESASFNLYKGKQKILQQQLSLLRWRHKDLKLPRRVIPLNYRLQLRPILPTNQQNQQASELFTAPGRVEILIECLRRTDTVTLHASQKYIEVIHGTISVEAKYEPGSIMDEKQPKCLHATGRYNIGDEGNDFYQIQLSEYLRPGNHYLIAIEFTSKIANDSLHGLYVSSYLDEKTKEKRYLATTQFEDIAARRMFPCFDEPDLKATFNIIVSRHKSYNAMSNTRPYKSTPDPAKRDYVLDHFESTPKMSTYLVALVVSDFVCVSASEELFRQNVQVCGSSYQIDRGEGNHAAEISARILSYYDQLWGVPYPMGKMQSVAIPDFAPGAMENWGLNTYRLTALLYSKGESTEQERSQVESTIAHELAHQNFGNLVTCARWNHIFLNEGFATYVAQIGVGHVSPEWDIENSWYSGYWQSALWADAKQNSHPLVKEDAMFGDFDTITYSKGASMIKMMEHTISKEVLLQGLRSYLKYYSFGNTKYEDLYERIDEAVKFTGKLKNVGTVKDLMDRWTTKPGFPLLRVSQKDTQTLHVSQERFIDNQDPKLFLTLDLTRETWNVPIFLHLSSEQSNTEEPAFWLRESESRKLWTFGSGPTNDLANSWLIVNPDAKSFVRVLYDEALSSKIQQQLIENPEVFSPITRASLINDAFACSFAGYSTFKVALDRTALLDQETHSIVWKSALQYFGKFFDMLSENSAHWRKLCGYLVPKLERALVKIESSDSKGLRGVESLLKSSLLVWGARLGSPYVKDFANNLMTPLMQQAHVERLNSVPVDIRKATYCAFVQQNSSNFHLLDSWYVTNNEISYKDKQRVLYSLTCLNDQNIAKEVVENLGKYVSKGLLSEPLAVFALQKIASAPLPQTRVWLLSSLKEKFSKIQNSFGGIRVFASVLQTLSTFWNTHAHLALVNEFVDEFSEELKKEDDRIAKGILDIEQNIIWMNQHEETIQEWLYKQQI